MRGRKREGALWGDFPRWGIVTAKMATPTKIDSELSDAHLESLERREGERGMPLRPKD